MRNLIQSLTLLFLITSCTPQKESRIDLNELAIEYVKLGLEIAEYDPSISEGYYGPDSLKFSGVKLDSLPEEDLINRINLLKSELAEISNGLKSSDEEKLRANWISSQLTAFNRRINIVVGEFSSFDEEAMDLYGVKIPNYDSTYFNSLIAELNDILPGEGTITDRKEALISRFEIPDDKLDTCFKVAIEAARKITQARFDLPKDENFTLEFVRDKVWGGINQYQGDYLSLCQINIDRKIYVDVVIDYAAHEGYPGHHVFGVMLEKNLYVDKGWVEISLNPVFSPQAFIAEGTAMYATDLAFPGETLKNFAKEVLMPLAGLDTTGVDAYFKFLDIKSKLGYAAVEAARGIVNNTMTEDEYMHWLNDFAMKGNSVHFIKATRSYIANYSYGKELVKNYIESQSSSFDDRWKAFDKLLSNPILPDQLREKE